jgi:hypothetical protein
LIWDFCVICLCCIYYRSRSIIDTAVATGSDFVEATSVPSKLPFKCAVHRNWPPYSVRSTHSGGTPGQGIHRILFLMDHVLSIEIEARGWKGLPLDSLNLARFLPYNQVTRGYPDHRTRHPIIPIRKGESRNAITQGMSDLAVSLIAPLEIS